MLNQISIWLRKATMSGSIHEANAMSEVGEKGCARAHEGLMTTFAFDAQFLLDVTLRSDQAHQGFGLMRVLPLSVVDNSDSSPKCLTAL